MLNSLYLFKFNFSQNLSTNDDWTGFEQFSEPAPTNRSTENNRKSSTKMQTKSSVEDFSSLDVKSKATTIAKKPQESSRNKAEQDAWELLNS